MVSDRMCCDRVDFPRVGVPEISCNAKRKKIGGPRPNRNRVLHAERLLIKMVSRTKKTRPGRTFLFLAFTSPRGYIGPVSSQVHLDQASLPTYLGVPRQYPRCAKHLHWKCNFLVGVSLLYKSCSVETAFLETVQSGSHPSTKGRGG